MDIVCKSVSKTKVGDVVFFAIGFDTVDASDKHVDATFSITTEETTLPMVGITPYGMLIGQIASNGSAQITVGVTDGTTTVESTNTLTALSQLEVGTELTADNVA